MLPLTLEQPPIRRGSEAAPPPPLSVCLISEEYPPETGWGGIGTYTFNLARGLVELGHGVDVIARCWGEDRLERVDGVNVHRLSIGEPSWRRGTWFVNIRFPETRQIVLWNRRIERRIRDITRSRKIDVIETPEYHAQGLFTAVAHPGAAVVVRLHTPAFLCRRLNGVAIGGSRWDARISENLECRLTRRAALVTAPSQSMADEVAVHWGLNRSRIAVLPNPVDEDAFCPGDHHDDPRFDPRSDPRQDRERERQGRGPTVLFVGRLERRKGVETLARAMIEVFRAFPSARVRFVGNDHPSGPGGASMRQTLQTLFDAEGVSPERVDLTGALDRAALPALYRDATVCVVPSLYESFGYTCVEAMACGTPVIASSAGALAEIVRHEWDGLLVPPENPSALAGAILRLLRDPALCARLASRARETVVQRFSRRAVSERTVDLYRSLIQRRNAERA